MSPRARATASTSQYSRFSRRELSRMEFSRISKGKDQFSLLMRTIHCLLAVLGLEKVLRHAADKRNRPFGNLHVTLENGVEAVRLAEVELGVLGVLAHAGAVQIDAGEQPLVARVAEQLGVRSEEHTSELQ